MVEVLKKVPFLWLFQSQVIFILHEPHSMHAIPLAEAGSHEQHLLGPLHFMYRTGPVASVSPVYKRGALSGSS